MVRFKSKEIYNFLREYCKIPSGKKSGIIKTPLIIKRGSAQGKMQFMAGFFDTDGGVQGGAFGFHIASKVLRDEISKMLLQSGFNPSIRNCLNKKQGRYYYQLSLSKRETIKLITTLPLRNKAKIQKISKIAGVAEPGQTC